MPRRNVPERSPFLTAGLIVLLIWNGYQASWCLFLSIMAPVISRGLDEPRLQRELERRELPVDEIRQAVSDGVVLIVVDLNLRIMTCVCLGMLFLWKRWAFWGFVACTALVFLDNLWGGTSIWEASLDLVGLAVLIALLFKSEPAAWPQLK